MRCELARTLIDQQVVEEQLPPLQEQALRIHLRGCDDCRALYDRASAVETALAGQRIPAARIERMVARGLPAEAPAPRRVPLRLVAPLLAAAAAAAVFVALPRQDPEVGVRGGTAQGRQGWVSVYRSTGGAPQPLAERLAVGEGLLFAYSNLKSSPHRHLLIAGLDAKGRAHWYHPAFSSEADRPASVPIERGVADVQLPERIHADHAAGKLTICAVFTEAPLQVIEVDRILESTGRWPEDAELDCRTVEVTE